MYYVICYKNRKIGIERMNFYSVIPEPVNISSDRFEVFYNYNDAEEIITEIIKNNEDYHIKDFEIKRIKCQEQ